MPVYYVYMLKASACLSVIYFFYVLFFRGTTYYIANRYFLLFFSILACIVPFINRSVLVNTSELNNITFFSKVPTLPLYETTGNETTGFPVWQILGIIFLIGLSVMIIRLFVQLLSLWKMHLKATLLQDGEVKLYNISEPIVPFSYLNNIYVNKDNYSQDELDEIVRHELVHVQQKHTIDMLITEIICMLNWYNPIVWLLKKAVKENLEFIADDVVIKKGADKKGYQYLLLKVTGDVSFSIANNLNFLSLKNRIRMMNKAKSNKLHLLKFALVIPIVTIVLLAFRNKQEVATQKGKSAITKRYVLNSLTYSIPDKKVEAVVKNNQQSSLLKIGEDLNLDMVFNERLRLKELLEKNGYDNIGKHAIVFMIDTTSGNNSFSIQVNINLAKDEIKGKEQPLRGSNIDYPVDNKRSTFSSADQIQINNKEALENVGENESSTKALKSFNKLSTVK